MKLNKIKGLTPTLSVVVVITLTGVSLYNYKAPSYVLESQAAQINDEETETEEPVERAAGDFDLEDGIYNGKGTGFAGTISVAVEIESKSIIAIEITEVEADDASFMTRAKGVIESIINTQTLDVDAVSGATYSSNGIIAAVKNALTGEEDDGETAADSLAAALGDASVSAIEEPKAYKDGTYYGSGTGFKGTVKVKVVISNGAISSIDVESHNDDSPYFNNAMGLIPNIISTQSSNVDTVSGATYSSKGIIEAVRDALSQAAVNEDASQAPTSESDNSNNQSSTPAVPETSGAFPYIDGIYYGTGEGYKSDITVALTIKSKTITAIKVEEANDDEPFFSNASKLLNTIITKQSAEVDAVSGATYSSEGIIAAVKNALEEAKKATQALENPDSGKESNTDNNNEDKDKDKEDNSSDGDNNTGENSTGNNGTDVPEGGVMYTDGEYKQAVVCVPDEDEDFMPYNLTMTITIKNDKIVSVTNITGDGDSSNDYYIKRAAEGTSSLEGVVSQIISKGADGKIDAVTRATCTSISITEACKNALANAKIK